MTKFLGGEEFDHMQKCRAREVGHVGAVDKDDKRHSQVFMSLVIQFGKKTQMTVSYILQAFCEGSQQGDVIKH